MQQHNLVYTLFPTNNNTSKALLFCIAIFYAWILSLHNTIKKDIQHKYCIFFLMFTLLIPYNAWAQNDNIKPSSNPPSIKQENTPENIKLKQVSIFGTSTLPFYDLYQKDIVEIIAHTLASLDALKKAGQNLKNNTVASKGAYTLAQRTVIAAYIFNATSQTSINVEKINSGDSKLLTVMVKLEPDVVNFNSKINKMFQMPDFFVLCENILKSLDNLSEEASYFINRVNTSNNTQYTSSNYVLWERITHIAYNIESLWSFLKLLPYLENIWENPEKIQKDLEALILKAPHEALLWTALGEVQLQQDLPQDALNSFNKALFLSPKLARTLHARGLAHLRLQHSALAEKDISDALEFYPDVTTWLRSRGAVYMLREKYDLMCIDFQRACALGDCDGLKLARKKKLCLKP